MLYRRIKNIQLWYKKKKTDILIVYLSIFNKWLSRLINFQEELVQKCFISEEKLLVIVNEGIDEKLINNLHRSEEAAIVSIVFSKLSVEDSYSTALKNGNWFQTGKYYRDQWKSKGFLVSALSAVNLQEKLEKLKYTRWWNSAGYFLIFEETIETLASNSIIKPSGCSNAYDYLSLAWKYNILSVVFLCKEVDESLMMYSFDPFGHDSAPSPWLKAREMKGRQNHPWILFKWEKYNGRYKVSITFFLSFRIILKIFNQLLRYFIF